MAKDVTPAAADLSADQGDGDWAVESHSVDQTPPPLDTTEAAIAAEAKAAAAAAPKVAAKPAGTVAPVVEDGDQVSASDDDLSESASVDAAKPEPKAAAKKKTLDDRQKSLTKEINQLTYQKHATAKDIADAQKTLTALRAELAETERKLGKDTPPKKAAVGSPDQPATAASMPVHPKYTDFETDEQYTEAEGKWHTEVATWQTAREAALEAKIAAGVDQRLTADQRRRQAEASVADFATRLETAKAAHPDWDEKAAGLADVRSPWAASDAAPTPFLTDLARYNEDGPEVLYWLASHPDEAQELANLLPTRPMRDALLESSSAVALLEHFATPEGQQAFQAMQRMHPVRLMQAIGALSARLTAESSGPAPTVPRPITSAVPSAKPPVGSPRARSEPGVDDPNAPFNFEKWNADEDRRERKEKERLLGLSAAR